MPGLNNAHQEALKGNIFSLVEFPSACAVGNCHLSCCRDQPEEAPDAKDAAEVDDLPEIPGADTVSLCHKTLTTGRCLIPFKTRMALSRPHTYAKAADRLSQNRYC